MLLPPTYTELPSVDCNKAGTLLLLVRVVLKRGYIDFGWFMEEDEYLIDQELA